MKFFLENHSGHVNIDSGPPAFSIHFGPESIFTSRRNPYSHHSETIIHMPRNPHTPTRERAGPEMFLKHYRGYLQADAYVAYGSFFTNPARGVVEVACWAHTRRHFHQALDVDSARMGAVLAYLAQLYAVEKRARRSGVEGDELRLLREQASRPVLTQLHEYLLKIRDHVLPKSEAGQAVS
jgi:hypothetical protein